MLHVLLHAVSKLIDFAVWFVQYINWDWVSQPCSLQQSILEIQTSISNHVSKYTKLLQAVEPREDEMCIQSLSLPGMQVTCWKLCLTQPHPKSLCLLSVWYLCQFCLDKDCRTKLSAFQKNAFKLYMDMVRQQFFFLPGDLWSHCALLSSVICKGDSWEGVTSEGWETNCGLPITPFV